MTERKQIMQYLSSNRQDITRKYRLKKIGIFGSYARNEQTPESDLDLLVEFEEDTPDLTGIKERLRAEIQAIFHIPVDICREKYIKAPFKEQILVDALYV